MKKVRKELQPFLKSKWEVFSPLSSVLLLVFCMSLTKWNNLGRSTRGHVSKRGSDGAIIAEFQCFHCLKQFFFNTSVHFVHYFLATVKVLLTIINRMNIGHVKVFKGFILIKIIWSSRWELWRAPVIQLLGGLRWERLEGGGPASRCTMSIGCPH